MATVLAALLLGSSLQIHSSIDGAQPRPGWVYARVDQRVVLHALGPKADGYTWLELQPIETAVDNTQPQFHFEQIHYRAVERTACRGRTQCPVTAPGLAPHAPGAGTTAWQLKARLSDGTELSTPGAESTKWGGLTRDVLRVTFRLDDSALGYLTELIGVPYIFGSAGPRGRNQTDLLIGADCADLVVYGQRRMGRSMEYTSTYGLASQGQSVGEATLTHADGRALTAAGQTIAVRPGDLLRFPASRHVGVLWEDRPPVGILDAGDLLLHTCWDLPKIEPLGQNTACASLPWQVRRLPSPAAR